MNINTYIILLIVVSSCATKTTSMGEVAAAELTKNLLFLETFASHSRKPSYGSSPDCRAARRPTPLYMSTSPLVSDCIPNSSVARITYRPIEPTAQEILNDALRASKFWDMPVMQILAIHLQKEKEGLHMLKQSYVTADCIKSIYRDPTLHFDYTNLAYYIYETTHEIKATELALELSKKT